MDVFRASGGEVDPRSHRRVLDSLLDAGPEQLLGGFHRLGLGLLQQPPEVLDGAQQILAAAGSPDSCNHASLSTLGGIKPFIESPSLRIDN
jgi:hypothetical protein